MMGETPEDVERAVNVDKTPEELKRANEFETPNEHQRATAG